MLEVKKERDRQEGTSWSKKFFVFLASLAILGPYLLLMKQTVLYSMMKIKRAKRTQPKTDNGICLLISNRKAASSLCQEEPLEILKKASADNL